MKGSDLVVRLGLTAWLVWLVSSLLLFAIHAVSAIDGPDLYFFVCHGRDFATGYQPSQMSSYIYFPGVYRFWAVVFSVFPNSTQVVQWTVMLVLLINSLLVGILVHRLADSLWFSGLASALYVAFATRFEGLEGTGEPLATIPFLIGVVCWLSSRQLLIRSVGFGVALGFTVYMKQQAGLLTLGVAALFFLSDTKAEGPPRASDRNIPFVLAGLALFVFLALLLLEGRGLLPLTAGLKMVGAYDTRGSWLGNLNSLCRNDESVLLFSGLCGIGIVLSIWQKGGLNQRQAQTFALLAISAGATLFQFRVRGYYHYFLLALPSVVIISTATVAVLWKHVLESTHTRTRLLAMVVLSIPFLVGFIRVGMRSHAFELFNPIGFTSNVETPWHDRDDYEREIQRLSDLLPSGSELVVLPPNRSAICFATGTVNPEGYAFGKVMDVRRHLDSNLEAIVSFVEPRQELEEVDWKNTHSEELYGKLVADPRFEQIDVGTRLQLFIKRQH